MRTSLAYNSNKVSTIFPSLELVSYEFRFLILHLPFTRHSNTVESSKHLFTEVNNEALVCCIWPIIIRPAARITLGVVKIP